MADFDSLQQAVTGQPDSSPVAPSPDPQQGGILPSLSQSPSLLDQAREQYPLLKNHDIGYKENIGGGQGYMESWPPGETGTADSPRPAEFNKNQFGVENYSADSKPSDLAADVTSHHLINADPTIKKAYQDFQDSMTPWQESILKDQYAHAQANEGEKRPYAAWKAAAGVPAFFRGYTFGQWPASFNDEVYTSAQKQMLDGVISHLKGQQ
jgi:hypothetical protein